ncbi:MAG: LytTR family DNA-binding domain-containing protein [Bacteroidota bacterium]
MKLSALIVDDEASGRENLAHLLHTYCPEIDVLDLADSGESARLMVEAYQPDVVFLDIHMPQMDGFAFLDSLSDRSFSVVIVTAHDTYGIRAVKASAVDYLLKPLSIQELKEAVAKLLEVHRIKSSDPNLQQNYEESVNELVKSLLEQKAPQKLTLPHSHGFSLVDMSDIIRLEADDNYTWVYVQEMSPIHMPRTMKYVESILKGDVFMRIHRSHIINLSYLKTFSKSEGGYVMMEDGSRVPISRRRLPRFLDRINGRTNN